MNGAGAMSQEHLVDHVLAGHTRQEVVDDGPLVQPARQAVRRREIAFRAPLELRLGLHGIEDGVVQREERQLQLTDDGVLVVSRVPDQRQPLRVSWQVVDAIVVIDPQPAAVTSWSMNCPKNV